MKPTLSIFSFLLVLLGFAACAETTEPTEYDNWRERNDAFLDSLDAVAGNNYLVWNDPAPDIETRANTQVPQMNLGELYAVLVQDATTSGGLFYVYAKKLVDNPAGRRLLYTDEVKVYYHGTYINGVSFDGNFEGYGALDQQIPLTPEDMIWPTPFDEPATWSVNGMIDGMIDGMIWALQFMREGERWLLHIPYNVAYGESDYTPYGSSNTIPGCSVLTFDVVVDKLAD